MKFKKNYIRVDYTQSNNPQSLIGRFLMGGGVVNLNDNQTITGIKTFTDKIELIDEVGYEGIDFIAKLMNLPGNETAVPNDSWIRVGEWSAYGVVSLISISTRIGKNNETQTMFAVSIGRNTVNFNLLSSLPVAGDISAVRILSNGSSIQDVGEKRRFLEFKLPNGNLSIDDTSTENMTLTILNSARTTGFQFYDEFTIGEVPDGYTEYVLNLTQ